jgi:hypothetical protein
MGWSINLEKNTVVIPAEAAAEFNANEDFENDDITLCENDDGTFEFYFNDDHYEHMDYMERDDILEFALSHKLNGDVCFSSNQGDNRGQSWGYRFKDGALTVLSGRKSWAEVEPA